jgi:ubiquinone biosynthesis protein UbiJ
MFFGIPQWALGVGFIVLAVSIGRVIAAMMGAGGRIGRSANRRELARTALEVQGKLGELEDVQRRLDEVDDLQRRVNELEERVDFTERLLARQREGERIAPPKH